MEEIALTYFTRCTTVQTAFPLPSSWYMIRAKVGMFHVHPRFHNTWNLGWTWKIPIPIELSHANIDGKLGQLKMHNKCKSRCWAAKCGVLTDGMGSGGWHTALRPHWLIRKWGGDKWLGWIYQKTSMTTEWTNTHEASCPVQVWHFHQFNYSEAHNKNSL